MLSKKEFFSLFILFISFNFIFSQKFPKKFRSLKSHPFLNVSSQDMGKLKLHSKLLQTVYSDSFSKNFYYTTLYLGDQKVRVPHVQTAANIKGLIITICIIDTNL